VLDFLSRLDEGSVRVEILAFATSKATSSRAAKKRQRIMRSMDVSPMVVLTHQMVGGVVDHAWSLESNISGLLQAKSQLERASHVQAVLTDYLGHTHVGKVVKAPEKDSKQVGTKVIWKRRTFKVFTRSVFSRTGWVHRVITGDELMDVYDVGVGDRKLMNKALSVSTGIHTANSSKSVASLFRGSKNNEL
jgi:hypothetical protein